MHDADISLTQSLQKEDIQNDAMSCDEDQEDEEEQEKLRPPLRFPHSPFGADVGLPLDTTLHDSVLEITPSGKRWNVSRTCLNRLPYFHNLILNMETYSKHHDCIFHEILPIYEGDNYDKRVGKRQVFRVLEEDHADTMDYVIQALHCLYQSEEVLTPIVRKSRDNGDILLLLQHCVKYVYKALAYACRQELARMIIDSESFSLDEVMHTIELFDENGLATDNDDSFAAKSEHELAHHPILLALLHRLRTTPLEHLDNIVCSHIPSFALLKLIIFAGMDGPGKQVYFAEALTARALMLANLYESMTDHPIQHWDQLVINICKENNWEKARIKEGVKKAWTRSLGMERTPLSAQRRAISDTRHNRNPRHSREASRGRTTSHPPILPNPTRPSVTWVVDVDTVFHFSVDDTAAYGTFTMAVIKSASQQCQLPQRSVVDSSSPSSSSPLLLPPPPPPLQPIFLTLFVARETTGVTGQYKYRLCSKLSQLATAEFSGVLHVSSPLGTLEEARLYDRKVSTDPLALHAFEHLMPTTCALPVRLYGILTQTC